MKALKAGKHVLLEKPSTSNASEARTLFRNLHVVAGGSSTETNPHYESASSLVLLDAVHVRFHPAWQKFLSLIDPSTVAEATSTHHLPKGSLPADDIRFQYALSGGCLMDFGSYNVQTLRQVFGAEPIECVRASARPISPGSDPNIDQAFAATWRFPNGGSGSIVADFAATGGYCLQWLTERLPAFKLPMCSVRHRERTVPRADLPGGVEEAITRTVVIWNLTFASIWHRIDVVEEHLLRRTADGRVERRWVDREYFKQYAFADGDQGEDSWTTHRYQLEQFVNKVKGRRGSGVWIDGEDSIRQMEMIDQAYQKAGMLLRPTSSYTE